MSVTQPVTDVTHQHLLAKERAARGSLSASGGWSGQGGRGLPRQRCPRPALSGGRRRCLLGDVLGGHALAEVLATRPDGDVWRVRVVDRRAGLEERMAVLPVTLGWVRCRSPGGDSVEGASE